MSFFVCDIPFGEIFAEKSFWRHFWCCNEKAVKTRAILRHPVKHIWLEFGLRDIVLRANIDSFKEGVNQITHQSQ